MKRRRVTPPPRSPSPTIPVERLTLFPPHANASTTISLPSRSATPPDRALIVHPSAKVTSAAVSPARPRIERAKVRGIRSFMQYTFSGLSRYCRIRATEIAGVVEAQKSMRMEQNKQYGRADVEVDRVDRGTGVMTIIKVRRSARITGLLTAT